MLERAVTVGAVTADEAERARGALRERGEQGAFLAALPVFLAAGVKH